MEGGSRTVPTKASEVGWGAQRRFDYAMFPQFEPEMRLERSHYKSSLSQQVNHASLAEQMERPNGDKILIP